MKNRRKFFDFAQLNTKKGKGVLWELFRAESVKILSKMNERRKYEAFISKQTE
jgi:hypothetical protein